MKTHFYIRAPRRRDEGVERLAKSHFEEDVLAGEIGEVGVVLFDELRERSAAARRSAGVGHERGERREPRVSAFPGGSLGTRLLGAGGGWGYEIRSVGP